MVTWEVKITPINISTYEASIVGTRTDDEGSKSYTVPRATIETGPQQIAVMDEIWEKYQNALSDAAAVESFVAAKEAAGKANLEARE